MALTQKQIASLFETERSVVTKHIGNAFRKDELDEKSVCAKFAHTASDGKTYQVRACCPEIPDNKRGKPKMIDCDVKQLCAQGLSPHGSR